MEVRIIFYLVIMMLMTSTSADSDEEKDLEIKENSSRKTELMLIGKFSTFPPPFSFLHSDNSSKGASLKIIQPALRPDSTRRPQFAIDLCCPLKV